MVQDSAVQCKSEAVCSADHVQRPGLALTAKNYYGQGRPGLARPVKADWLPRFPPNTTKRPSSMIS